MSKYKRRYGVESSKSPDLLAVVTRNARRYYERVGRRWTKARIRREIRARAERGLALNHNSVAKGAKALENAALRTFGSWDAALRSSGFSVRKARRARSWTPESLIDAIRRLKRARRPINAKAVEKADRSLHQSARRWFGTWDAVLRAAGIEPLTVRHSRVWTRRDVLREIQVRAPMRSGEAFLRHRKLWVAANKHFGSWKQAIRSARVHRELER